jgi:hypothetical protein
MIRYVVSLSREEREGLDVLVKTGERRAQMVLNALILLACDEGNFQKARSTNEEVSRVLKVSMRKIDRVKKRFVEEGLEVALNNKKGERVYTRKVDGDFEARLVALSCSTPPSGYARWSLRLLADKVVELGYIDDISHESIRTVLKKTRLNRGSGKGG